MECKICGSINGNSTIKFKEMLIGTRDEFEYTVCNECRSMQIKENSCDMNRYYDNNTYASFQSRKISPLKKQMLILRNKKAILHEGGLISAALNKYRPLSSDFTLIGEYATTNSHILDVGCGSGTYINDLYAIGFNNVSGIDPYIAEDIVRDNKPLIRKLYIEDVNETYDFIISHHSFEHVSNPIETLASINRALKPGGVCFLTIPVIEELFDIYREHSYIIQAPQHAFMYSIKAIEILAKRTNFIINKIVRDPNVTEEWYKLSELNRRNIAYNEVRRNSNKYFDKEELRRIRQLRDHYKKNGLGDNVTFVLMK